MQTLEPTVETPQQERQHYEAKQIGTSLRQSVGNMTPKKLAF